MNITPAMLPLINLSQAEIDMVISQIPGGVANVQDIYGLVPQQHDMLFQYLMAKQESTYVFATRMQFTKRVALDRYAAALQRMIERHDILRTAFIWKGLNEPVQIVCRQVPSIITEITLNDTGKSESEQLNQYRHQLNLTEAPLLRLLVAPTNDYGWVALQVMHHLIGDSATIERLQTEVRTIITGHCDQLAVPIPYRYVVARARLGVSQAEHSRFFSEMLADIDEPTLPFGLSVVGQYGIEMNSAQLKLPLTLNDQLRTRASSLRVSLTS